MSLTAQTLLYIALPPWAGSFSRVDSPSRSPRQLFWLLQISGWVTLVVFSAIVAVLLFGDLTNVVILGIFRPIVGFFLSLGLWQIYRHWPASGFNLPQHVPPIILACLGATALDVAITETGRHLFEAPSIPEMAQLGAVFIRLVIYGAWSSLYFGIRQEIESRFTAARLTDAIAANREVELQLLRAQLSPDFFLNALNTISTEAKAGHTATVVETTQAVAEYLRYAYSQGTRTHYARLGGELDAMAGYLRAERARLGAGRFDWNIEATKEARNVSAPTTLLQPLIENAIKYGLRTSPPPLRLSIGARVQAGELVITVENSGAWVAHPREDETRNGAGFGLRNLRRRLALLYDHHARIDATSPANAVRIEVRLPVAGT